MRLETVPDVKNGGEPWKKRLTDRIIYCISKIWYAAGA